MSTPELGGVAVPEPLVLKPATKKSEPRPYVVLRKDQKLVRISNLRATPTVNGTVAVGSEPTSLALTPSGARASHWWPMVGKSRAVVTTRVRGPVPAATPASRRWPRAAASPR